MSFIINKIFVFNGISVGSFLLLAPREISLSRFRAGGTLISELKGLFVVRSDIVVGTFSLKTSSSRPGALSPYFARNVVLSGRSVVILMKEPEGFSLEFSKACGRGIGRFVFVLKLLLKDEGSSPEGFAWSDPTPFKE